MEPMKGSLRDSHFDYVLARHWIEPAAFVTFATPNSTGQLASLSCGYVNDGQQQLCLLSPVGGSRITAVRFATIAATLAYTWHPWNFDNRHPLYVRYHWTTNNNIANGLASFTTALSTTTPGNAVATPTTIATPAAGGRTSSSAVNAYAITRAASFAPLGTGAFAFETFAGLTETVVLNFSVASLTLGAITTDFVYLYGVELLYTPKQTYGDGSAREARFVNPPLESMEAPPTRGIRQSQL